MIIDETQVWLKFDGLDDEDASHEANIYPDEEGYGYRVTWYHTAVGQETSIWFDRVDDAEDFLRSGGYENFTA